MTFSFPTIKEFMKILSIDCTSNMKHINTVDGTFYYLPSTTEEYSCGYIYEDDSFTTLIDALSHALAVVIINKTKSQYVV